MRIDRENERNFEDTRKFIVTSLHKTKDKREKKKCYFKENKTVRCNFGFAGIQIKKKNEKRKTKNEKQKHKSSLAYTLSLNSAVQYSVTL